LFYLFLSQATPEEIAYSCAFYCSDGGAYLNGTFLLQDGGLRDHSSDRAPVLEKIAADRATLSGPEVCSRAPCRCRYHCLFFHSLYLL
jgi:hypothetical protein